LDQKRNARIQVAIPSNSLAPPSRFQGMYVVRATRCWESSKNTADIYVAAAEEPDGVQQLHVYASGATSSGQQDHIPREIAFKFLPSILPVSATDPEHCAGSASSAAAMRACVRVCLLARGLVAAREDQRKRLLARSAQHPIRNSQDGAAPFATTRQQHHRAPCTAVSNMNITVQQHRGPSTRYQHRHSRGTPPSTDGHVFSRRGKAAVSTYFCPAKRGGGLEGQREEKDLVLICINAVE
jgi:hypothetical protein